MDRLEFLKERCIKEYNLGEKISSIWIAPQERFMLPTIQKIFAKYNTPVAAIDMRTFGTMNVLSISGYSCIVKSIQPHIKVL